MTKKADLDEATTVLLGAAAIVVLAVCVGLVVNHLSSDGLPLFASQHSLRPPVSAGATYMSIDEAREFLDEQGAIFLDARPAAAFDEGHIEGAVSLPVEDFAETEAALRDALRGATVLICYCDGIDCEQGAQLADQLVNAGYYNVALMFEGWEEWERAGYPASSAAEERQ
ncbi:MAG: rhodanese-like domain-containing protein [Armatimonadota bacterium]|nr:MAG: rhodanese-like domain-containing protein [Armatimonadota bacterium]